MEQPSAQRRLAAFPVGHFRRRTPRRKIATMLDVIIREHDGKPDRELLHTILVEFYFLNNKIDKFMSEITDKIAAISATVDGIATDVASIGTEITDLKNQVANGQDATATVAALDGLATKVNAAKAALDALVPATAPAGDAQSAA